MEGKKLKDVLLEPTRIYVEAAQPLIKERISQQLYLHHRWRHKMSTYVWGHLAANRRRQGASSMTFKALEI